MFEQKSPIQSYKCFNMKYKSSPKDSTNFGEVTSSSFEHVNADQLYVNHNVDNDQRHQISHFNSKLKEAMMRPLPKVPDNKVRLAVKYYFYYLRVISRGNSSINHILQDIIAKILAKLLKNISILSFTSITSIILTKKCNLIFIDILMRNNSVSTHSPGYYSITHELRTSEMFGKISYKNSKHFFSNQR